MDLQNTLASTLTLENDIGVDLDAVMHKVTQESGELIQALQANNKDEIVSELWDVLFNVLSVTNRLGIAFNPPAQQCKHYTPVDIAIGVSSWNDAIQKYRWIYARWTVSLDIIHQQTMALWDTLIGVCYEQIEDINPIELVYKNYEKFAARQELYKKNIQLWDYIRNIDDYPKPGIAFKDITPLLQSPVAFVHTIKELAKFCVNADVIVWLDARWFIFGGAVAHYLGKPFVPVRKKGKLPYTTIDEKYDLEYGSNEVSIHTDAIQPWQKVAIVDDLLATGWTAKAAINLVEKLWWAIDGAYFVIGLDDLPGKQKLADYNIKTLIDY